MNRKEWLEKKKAQQKKVCLRGLRGKSASAEGEECFRKEGLSAMSEGPEKSSMIKF